METSLLETHFTETGRREAMETPAVPATSVYQCTLCGTTVEMLDDWAMDLLCCGRQMDPIPTHSSGRGRHQHCPVIEPHARGFRVYAGRTPHPTREDHHILWIDLLADGKSYREFFPPGRSPEAFFPVQAEKVTARAYCRLHGLWSSSYSRAGEAQ